MKSFILAATVVAGLLSTANTADAQFRRGRGIVVQPSINTSPYYNSGSYYAPAYTPTYTYPVYESGVVQSSYYTPSTTYYNSSSYSSPIYPSAVYPSPMYSSPFYGSSSYNSGYYNNGYYGSGYNNGLNISPAGGSFYGRSWRW